MGGGQRQSLVALAIVFALTLGGLVASDLWQARRDALAAAVTQAQTAALFTATYTGRTYEVASHLLTEAEERLRQGGAPTDLQERLAQLTEKTSLDDYLVVTDSNGRIVLSSEHPSPPGVEFSDREWFRAHAAGAEQFVGPVLRSRVSGDVLWTMSRRLEDGDGRFVGAIALGARAIGVRPLQARPPTEPLATVWTRDGRMLAGNFVSFDAEGEALPIARPPVDLSARTQGLKTDGSMIAAYAPVPGWALVSVVSYEKAGVLAPWRREAIKGALLVVAALVGGALLVRRGLHAARREEETQAELTRAVEETRAALAQRDLLLKEVHHRVKNSLMMTASLLSLQARLFEDPRVRAAFDQTRSRLSSISLVHEALYVGDAAEVNVAGYLKRLLHEIAHAHGADERSVALSVDIDPVHLPPERATLVGLIVAEVVSNAFKHAFPDISGAIRVEAFAGRSGEVEVCVADDGVGYHPTAGPEERGLGTKLIRVLAEQLGGRISFTNDGGTTFRLSFPLHAGGAPKAAATSASKHLALQGGPA